MKSARHSMILELIDQYDINTQDELASMLNDRGVRVTQATVSRDIKDLRLIKVLTESGSYKYATVDKAEAGLKDRFISIFAHSVVSMAEAGNLIVIKIHIQPLYQSDVFYIKRCFFYQKMMEINGFGGVVRNV